MFKAAKFMLYVLRSENFGALIQGRCTFWYVANITLRFIEHTRMYNVRGIVSSIQKGL